MARELAFTSPEPLLASGTVNAQVALTAEGSVRQPNEWDTAREMVGYNPEVGVAAAGRELLQAITKAAAPFGKPFGDISAVKKLAAAGIIAKELEGPILTLIRLRNELAQQPSRSISAQNALEFVDAAESAAKRLVRKES